MKLSYSELLESWRLELRREAGELGKEGVK